MSELKDFKDALTVADTTLTWAAGAMVVVAWAVKQYIGYHSFEKSTKERFLRYETEMELTNNRVAVSEKSITILEHNMISVDGELKRLSADVSSIKDLTTQTNGYLRAIATQRNFNLDMSKSEGGGHGG